MTKLPILNLDCTLFKPCGQEDSVKCQNCIAKFTILAHAAAHQKEALKHDKIRISFLDSSMNIMDEKGYQEYLIKTHESFVARDAVLELAGLSEKDLKEAVK